MPKEEQYQEDHWDAEDASWEADAPLLASLERRQPDDVPEGYFASLPAQVMARIQAGEAAPSESEVASQPRASRPWRTMALLTSLLLLSAFALYMAWPEGSPAVSQEEALAIQLEQVEEADIMSELELSDLSEEELYEMLGKEAQAALGDEFGEFSQESLLDFLDDADLDAAAWEEMELDANFFNEATQ